MVAEAGYKIGLTNGSGVNRLWPTAISPLDPFDIRRLATDRAQSDAMFLMQIAIPQLAPVHRAPGAAREDAWPQLGVTL